MLVARHLNAMADVGILNLQVCSPGRLLLASTLPRPGRLFGSYVGPGIGTRNAVE